MRVGYGYDIHPLVLDRPLILGGVRIPFSKGLAGHSDADALCHAVADARTDLGQPCRNTAIQAPEIGRFLPVAIMASDLL